jgi:hypothetical protein
VRASPNNPANLVKIWLLLVTGYRGIPRMSLQDDHDAQMDTGQQEYKAWLGQANHIFSRLQII